MPLGKPFQSLFPHGSVITTDFSKLENRVMANALKHRGMGKSFKDAVYFGNSIHSQLWDDWYSKGIDVMPRRLYSFHPARNNQVTTTNVKTLADLQEALDLNPDFIHISCVQDGKHWLIHKGPVSAKSSTEHGRWKPISVPRLPKPIRMLLVIDPLMG
jgi:hypothetical protein